MQFGPVITLVSGQVSGVSNGTVTRTLADGSTVFGGLQNYDSFIALINVTAAGTATGTVNLYLQDSWDGGTTWDDVVASANLTLGSTIGTQRYVVQGRIATSITQGSAVSTDALTAATVRSGPFGDRLRVQEKVSGASGSPVGCTYSITIIPCRSQDS